MFEFAASSILGAKRFVGVNENHRGAGINAIRW